MSDQTKIQTVISLKTYGQDQVLGQNGIDIISNNDQKVKLVKQLIIASIRSFLQKLHNTVFPLSDKYYQA